MGSGIPKGSFHVIDRVKVARENVEEDWWDWLITSVPIELCFPKSPSCLRAEKSISLVRCRMLRPVLEQIILNLQCVGFLR